VKNIVFVTATGYTLRDLRSDVVLMVNANSAPIVINLPIANSAQGYQVTVKKTDASANAVTITAATGELIDAANTLAVTTQYGSKTLNAIPGVQTGSWAIESSV
jgi:hypothetical protein